MTPEKQFNRLGALYVKDVINQELAMFLTHCLMRSPAYRGGQKDDSQVPGAMGILDHEVLFETVHEQLWPAIENIVGEELLPTYSYARLYTNENVLEKHKDRGACEISVTVQLGRTHHYAWPIFMGVNRFDLAEGDGVIYKGCDVEHWREVCSGPEGYLSGQAFFHFVKKNGKYKDCAYDSRWDSKTTAYARGRTQLLRGK